MSFDERILNGMGVLTAIVESGSFASAGERLDMSQSGVSRSVARLEARLGIRLFDRTTRIVKLTDEGRRLYEQIVPLMDGLEEAAASAAGGATAVRGRLRVNVDPFFSKIVLSPRIGEFVGRYPELNLDLITRDQLRDMVADGFDLAVRFGEPRPSTLVARKLLDTRIMTAASPGYLKKYGRPLKPTDLEREPHSCIQYRDPETGRPFVWEFHRPRKKVIIDARGRLMVNDVSTMHGACLAGHGIAQIMALGTQPLFDSGRLVDLFPDWPDERFPLYALYPSRRHPSAKVRAFLDFIVKITGSPLNDKPWY
ncbi:LysR family transcriptional regulator [Paraburkholderia sabiae]|uniref:LysR family transcriptional regulator n=1 Tax=Paraburkholderia sabiae TaxID=273251 RepID=A0ABU9QC70_9BURK|nr:LysR family transcriptional regulator [Paraburkholderia sabiae]WJZ72573.1 LysR family transcriptional regulator [Paraburkholderia sabiae]CAD6558299.1 HTH-type transcriptional regulator DmlR [Paraburkholderia sabiae]